MGGCASTRTETAPTSEMIEELHIRLKVVVYLFQNRIYFYLPWHQTQPLSSVRFTGHTGANRAKEQTSGIPTLLLSQDYHYFVYKC
jgi:hypothetical protein